MQQPAKKPLRARIVVDMALIDQVGDIWSAASWWNRELGCKVFSLDMGDPTRGHLYFVSMLPWERKVLIKERWVNALADAIWNPPQYEGWNGYGVVRVYDTLEPPLQRHIYRHELGHILGLPDLYDDKDFGDLMFGIAYHGTSSHHTPSYTEATTVSPKVLEKLRQQHCGKVTDGDQDTARTDRVQGPPAK